MNPPKTLRSSLPILRSRSSLILATLPPSPEVGLLVAFAGALSSRVCGRVRIASPLIHRDRGRRSGRTRGPGVAFGDDGRLLDRFSLIDGPCQPDVLGMSPGERRGREGTLTPWEAG